MTSAFSGLRAGCAVGRAVCTRSSAGCWGVVDPWRVTFGSTIVRDSALGDAEDLLGLFDDLGNPERLAPDPVVALRVDEELGADQHEELAEVDLGDQHPAVAPDHLLSVRR